MAKGTAGIQKDFQTQTIVVDTISRSEYEACTACGYERFWRQSGEGRKEWKVWEDATSLSWMSRGDEMSKDLNPYRDEVADRIARNMYRNEFSPNDIAPREPRPELDRFPHTAEAKTEGRSFSITPNGQCPKCGGLLFDGYRHFCPQSFNVPEYKESGDYWVLVLRWILAFLILACVVPATVHAQTIDCSRYVSSSGSKQLTNCANAVSALSQGATLDARTGFNTNVTNPNAVQTWDTDAFSGITQSLTWICGLSYTVSANATIPANVHVVMLESCDFSVNMGITFTVNGPVDGSSQTQHFTGSGTVSFASNTTLAQLLPQWWGAQANNSHDDTAAIQSALSALPANGGTVFFPPGTYKITASLIPGTGAMMRGASKYQTVINNTNTSSADAIHTVSSGDGAAVAYFITITDMTIQGNSSSGRGIYIYAPFVVRMDNLRVLSNGGTGIVAVNGTGMNTTGQNVFLDNSFVQSNLGGGVKVDTAVIASFKNDSVDGNGLYGYYFKLTSTVKVVDGEVAGYVYGGVIAANQGVPVAINGGSNIVLDNVSFENNGGNGATASDVIRTGWDGDAQMNASNTTLSLTVSHCRFAAPNGQTGALQDIRFHFVQNASIGPGNQFEKGSAYPNTVYAYQFGTLASNSDIQFCGNRYGLPGTALDGFSANTYSGTFTGCDDFNSTGFNGFFAQTDAAGRLPFYVQFTGEAQPRGGFNGLGQLVGGPGGSTPYDVIFSWTSPGCSGGGCSIVGHSSDSFGRVTTTTTGAVSITITFGSGFTNAPACSANNETTGNLIRATSVGTGSMILVGTTASGDTISWTCGGR